MEPQPIQPASAPPALTIRRYEPEDKEAVVALWETCGLLVPWNDPRADIARKMEFQPELLLVGTLEGRVVAAVMAGYEVRRGWINYLGVAPDLQGAGIGRRIMEEAEAVLRRLGCPKINLQVRGSNRQAVAFYERLGYAVEDVISLGKRL